jgi:hypothetical protein
MDEETFRTGRHPDGSPVRHPHVAGGRLELPDRRETCTADFLWRDQKWTVSTYIGPEGHALELFVAPGVGGPKFESDTATATNLAAILVSRLLQHGERLPELIKSLTAGGWETGGDENPPLILAAMRRAVEFERPATKAR